MGNVKSKRSRRKRRLKRKRIIYVLLATLGIFLMLGIAIIFIKSNDKDNKSDSIEQVQQEQSNENYTNNTWEDVEDFEINSKYCKLYFPIKWEDKVEIKFSEEPTYKVDFYGVSVNKTEIHLFSVCFNSDDGELLGYLENEEEIVNISIDVKELEFDDSWKEEEIDQIYAMQEEMNYVMDTLNRNENYIEP